MNINSSTRTHTDLCYCFKQQHMSIALYSECMNGFGGVHTFRSAAYIPQVQNRARMYAHCTLTYALAYAFLHDYITLSFFARLFFLDLQHFIINVMLVLLPLFLFFPLHFFSSKFHMNRAYRTLTYVYGYSFLIIILPSTVQSHMLE